MMTYGEKLLREISDYKKKVLSEIFNPGKIIVTYQNIYQMRDFNSFDNTIFCFRIDPNTSKILTSTTIYVNIVSVIGVFESDDYESAALLLNTIDRGGIDD